MHGAAYSDLLWMEIMRTRPHPKTRADSRRVLYTKAKCERGQRPCDKDEQSAKQVMVRTWCDERTDVMEHGQRGEARQQDQGEPAEQNPSDQDRPAKITALRFNDAAGFMTLLRWLINLRPSSAPPPHRSVSCITQPATLS
jgi:hypothetical protein